VRPLRSRVLAVVDQKDAHLKIGDAGRRHFCEGRERQSSTKFEIREVRRRTILFVTHTEAMLAGQVHLPQLIMSLSFRSGLAAVRWMHSTHRAADVLLLALSVGSLRRSGAAGVGGEADMPRAWLNRRESWLAVEIGCGEAWPTSVASYEYPDGRVSCVGEGIRFEYHTTYGRRLDPLFKGGNDDDESSRSTHCLPHAQRFGSVPHHLGNCTRG
jgi:hypothetical protein